MAELRALSVDDSKDALLPLRHPNSSVTTKDGVFAEPTSDNTLARRCRCRSNAASMTTVSDDRCSLSLQQCVCDDSCSSLSLQQRTSSDISKSFSHSTTHRTAGHHA